jgi:uncharacterized protein YgbK (DUF1537 family)
MISRLGVVADDVTGATDLAGQVAAEGATVSLYFGVSAAEQIASDPADCVVVALKSRSLDPDEAVQQSLEAARALGAIDHLYVKYCSTFDSTARGNIGPVVEALADSRANGPATIVPSAPVNGRTVYRGRLFVGDALLEESSLRHHPLNPMTDSVLSRLLAPQARWPIEMIPLPTVLAGSRALIARLDELPARTHVIIDAVSDADLDTIARSVASRGFSSGSAGLAAALARVALASARDAEPVLHEVRPRRDGPAIVISGSLSVATRAQVASFRAHHPAFEVDPSDLAHTADVVATVLAAVEHALKAGQTPLVYSRMDAPGASDGAETEAASRLIEGALSEIAVGARELGVTRMVVAGGEVSGAVIGALGVTRVTVHEEVAPGVPWIVTDRPTPLALLLKSGNFGGPDFFDDAVGS